MRLLFIICFLLALNNVAHAWQASVDGPDVFGNVKVVATEGGLQESLVVQCDQKEDLFIAYIMRKKEFESVGTVPAELLIASSGKTPLRLEAEMRNWNNNYFGVVASGKTAQIVDAINLIKEAKGKIQVGAEVGGNQISSSFSSRGSTKSMEQAIKHCKLSFE